MKNGKTPVNWLRSFEVAARHLSLSAAASELNVTPAAVSQQVRLLERSEEHTSELQPPCNLVCRLLLEKKKTTQTLPPPTHIYRDQCSIHTGSTCCVHIQL